MFKIAFNKNQFTTKNRESTNTKMNCQRWQSLNDYKSKTTKRIVGKNPLNFLKINGSVLYYIEINTHISKINDINEILILSYNNGHFYFFK